MGYRGEYVFNETIGDSNNINYYQQCDIHRGFDLKTVWLSSEVTEKDGFIIFKKDGKWETDPWRIIRMSVCIDGEELKKTNKIDNVYIHEENVRVFEKEKK